MVNVFILRAAYTDTSIYVAYENTKWQASEEGHSRSHDCCSNNDQQNKIEWHKYYKFAVEIKNDFTMLNGLEQLRRM